MADSESVSQSSAYSWWWYMSYAIHSQAIFKNLAVDFPNGAIPLKHPLTSLTHERWRSCSAKLPVCFLRFTVSEQWLAQTVTLSCLWSQEVVIVFMLMHLEKKSGLRCKYSMQCVCWMNMLTNCVLFSIKVGCNTMLVVRANTN